MENLSQLTLFMGLCLAINIGFLVLSVLMLSCCRSMILAIHVKMFGVSVDYMLGTYLKYLSHYKLLILVFNVVPYLALKLMMI